MSATVQELEGAVSRVPMWGWLALAGGGVLIVLARHNATAAKVLDPNQATVDTGALPGQVYPPGGIDVGGITPGTTPDPSQTTASPAETLRDILGGDAGAFLRGETNQPDFVNITLPGGASITSSNSVGTFGGGNGTLLQSPDQTNADTAGFTARAFAALQQYLGQTNAQHVAYVDQTTAQLNAYEAQTNALERSFGMQISAQQGSQQCAPGDINCIKARCQPGDTNCARGWASWWQGTPIPGWG